jgi:UDP-N-acetylmuramoylalanine-D-glutamate ligase
MCFGITNWYKTRVYYLLDHPKLAWVKTNVTEMHKVNGALKVSDKTSLLMFGRIKYNGFQTLGKIYQKPIKTFVIKTSDTTKLDIETNFEVLLCLP